MRVDQYFWLYMLECENGSFYTGYTKNLAIRYYQHINGKQSARYTRSFKPVKIGSMLEVIRYYWDCFKSGAVYKETKSKDQITLG